MKNIKREKKNGGFFSLFTEDRETYTDLPPLVAVSSGIAICILLKAYLEKHLSFFWLILLVILTVIPSFLSFLRDAKEENRGAKPGRGSSRG